MIKVSVIIPVYDTAEYLEQCLDSVLNQTLIDIEIIVVDDASPDNSLEILRSYQSKDDRIKIIEKSENQGLPAARNSGVAISAGEYIIHLDSDDFWIDSNMLLELYEIAELEGCDILRFNGFKYEDGNLTSSIFNPLEMVNCTFDENRELWAYRSVFLFFFKKEFIDNNNLLFTAGISMGEDGVFLSSALVVSKKNSSTSRCYYAYRANGSSMMNRKWGIERFIEEEDSAQIIVNNLSNNKEIMNDYLSRRINHYWLSKVAVRAKRDLSKDERVRLYAHAQKNFLHLDIDSPFKFNRVGKKARLLHRLFVKSEYEKIDKFISDANLLEYTSVFSLPFCIQSLSKTKLAVIKIVKLFENSKKSLIKLLALKFNNILFSVFAEDRVFKNCEGLDEYEFCLTKKNKSSGLSAMLRVKNEEKCIQSCVESIINVFDEVVIIDNNSTDSTLEIVSKLMESEIFKEKIKLFSYPHSIARCGAENSSTPEDSVHSLAYFYNWCLGKCSYSVVCKWDADMLLSSSIKYKLFLKTFLSKFVTENEWTLGGLPIQTIYIDEENKSYRATNEVNSEIRVFPNSSNVYFRKTPLWEVLEPLHYMPVMNFDNVCIYEVKDVANNEFANWSDISFKNYRKVREYRNFMKVKRGLHKRRFSEFVPFEVN